MSRRAAALLVAVCAVVLVAAFWLIRGPAPQAAEEAAAPESAPLEVAPLERFPARLHRPAAGGGLAIEALDLESVAEPGARVAAALSALLGAAPAGDFGAVFPEPVAVRRVLLGGDGTLYVDLASESGGDPPPCGSTEELQRVYALVHTALDAAPDATRVVLLWNGVQRRSLAGHVDTARPLGRYPALETS